MFLVPDEESGLAKTKKPWLVAIAYTDLASDNRVIRAAEAAAESGFRVTMLVPRGEPRSSEFKLDGIEIETLNVDQERGRTTVRGQLRFIRGIKEWANAQDRRPDVVHVHNMPDYLYWAVRHWQKQGTRIVLDVHDVMSDLALHRFRGAKRFLASRVLRILERLVWKRVDHLITAHELYREQIVSASIDPAMVSVVLNVPDPAVCNSSMRRAPSDESFKIVFHGTISSRTGIAHAVRALPLVLREVPSARMVIIGSGDGVAEVHAEIRRLGLESQIEFVDKFLPMEQVIDFICDAHAATVPNEPSRYTNGILPVKLLEYVVLQIPVVATRLPLIDHYFSSDSPHLISEPTPELIAAGLIRIANDIEYREKLISGYADHLAKHGWERYRAVLTDALSAGVDRLEPLECGRLLEGET